MTVEIKRFTRHAWTREDARTIIASCTAQPDTLDFSDVVSISHCFADELFSRLAPAKPRVTNATPFVARIAHAAAIAAR